MEKGLAISVSCSWFDVVSSGRLVRNGLIRLFENGKYLQKLLAKPLSRYRHELEVASYENGKTGHDYLLLHVCIPSADRSGKSLGWRLYRTYMIDIQCILDSMSTAPQSSMSMDEDSSEMPSLDENVGALTAVSRE